MGLYALDETYSLSSWYENSGAFDLNTGTDLLLDQVRHLLESDNYTFQAVAFPKGKDIEVDLQQTFSGSLNLVPYSYIWGLCGYNETQGQFTLRIYDKGAQTDLYYGQFAWTPTVVGEGQAQMSAVGDFINLFDVDKPFGPYFFRAPWIVLPPGILQIQITDAAPITFSVSPVHVQLLFLIAVPRNTVTLNNRRVVTAHDQTGLQSFGSLATAANLVGG